MYASLPSGPSIATEVTMSAEGFARIQIIDTPGEQPTLFLSERPADGHMIWFGRKGSAFALNRDFTERGQKALRL